MKDQTRIKKILTKISVKFLFAVMMTIIWLNFVEYFGLSSKVFAYLIIPLSIILLYCLVHDDVYEFIDLKKQRSQNQITDLKTNFYELIERKVHKYNMELIFSGALTMFTLLIMKGIHANIWYAIPIVGTFFLWISKSSRKHEKEMRTYEIEHEKQRFHEFMEKYEAEKEANKKP